jgi:hypothetical protein
MTIFRYGFESRKNRVALISSGFSLSSSPGERAPSQAGVWRQSILHGE